MEEEATSIKEKVAAAVQTPATPPTAPQSSGTVKAKYIGEYDNYIAENGVEFFSSNGKIATMSEAQWSAIQSDEQLTKLA